MANNFNRNSSPFNNRKSRNVKNRVSIKSAAKPTNFQSFSASQNKPNFLRNTSKSSMSSFSGSNFGSNVNTKLPYANRNSGGMNNSFANYAANKVPSYNPAATNVFNSLGNNYPGNMPAPSYMPIYNANRYTNTNSGLGDFADSNNVVNNRPNYTGNINQPNYASSGNNLNKQPVYGISSYQNANSISGYDNPNNFDPGNNNINPVTPATYNNRYYTVSPQQPVESAPNYNSNNYPSNPNRDYGRYSYDKVMADKSGYNNQNSYGNAYSSTSQTPLYGNSYKESATGFVNAVRPVERNYTDTERSPQSDYDARGTYRSSINSLYEDDYTRKQRADNRNLKVKKNTSRYDDDYEEEYNDRKPSRRSYENDYDDYDYEDYDDYEAPRSSKRRSSYDDDDDYDMPKTSSKKRSSYDDDDDYDIPKTSSKKRSYMDDFDDEDDDFDDYDSKKSKRRSSYDDDYDDEDDDDDYRPSKKSKKRSAYDDDDYYDDDDDDYEDAPRRKKKKKKGLLSSITGLGRKKSQSEFDDYDDDDDDDDYYESPRRRKRR